MSGPYRLTIYVDGVIERMLPFDAPDIESAVVFADSQRYGRHAVLSNPDGLVMQFPDDTLSDVAGRLRREA